jgi:plastocyanin
MIRPLTLLIFSATLTLAQETKADAKAAPEAAAAAAEHHHEAAPNAGVASAGRKMELVAGLTAADFLRLSAKPKTVEITVIAVWNDENYGMNFNGYAKGGAIYNIPKGWSVEVTYINPSPIPHSVIVIEKDALKKIQVPEPYFKGAGVPGHLKGAPYSKQTFTFTADEAGEYALACGFPGHAMNGHWIGLDIDEKATAPTFKVGTADATPASPAKPAAAAEPTTKP